VNTAGGAFASRILYVVNKRVVMIGPVVGGQEIGVASKISAATTLYPFVAEDRSCLHPQPRSRILLPGAIVFV
jgi:hypothetical protein